MCCELQEYILTALASKTVVFVTHQVEFLPAADLILVWSCFNISALCNERTDLVSMVYVLHLIELHVSLLA